MLSALTELAAATPSGASRGQVYREIAQTYDSGIGDQLKAREFYRKALEEAPGDPEAERAMGALLGRLHPVGVAIAALGLGFLSSAGLEVGTEVPKELTEMLQGVLLLSIAILLPGSSPLPPR